MTGNELWRPPKKQYFGGPPEKPDPYTVISVPSGPYTGEIAVTVANPAWYVNCTPSSLNPNVTSIPEPGAALEEALAAARPEDTVLVAGSLILVGDVKRHLESAG